MAETVRKVSQSTAFVINPTQGLDLSSNNNQVADSAMHPTYDKLAEYLIHVVQDMLSSNEKKQYWIGIAGGPGNVAAHFPMYTYYLNNGNESYAIFFLSFSSHFNN